MSKNVVPLAVEIDEVALSVLGWDIANFQARLITEALGDTYYSVAASMELRFHPDDWQVKHQGSSDYLPDVIWQLRSRSKGPLSSYQCITLAVKPKEVRAPKMVSGKMQTWSSSSPVETTDIYVWVGGFDWEEIDGTRTQPAAHWADVRVEMLDHTTRKGVRTDIQEMSARVRDGEELEVTVRAIHQLGTPQELMDAARDFAEWSIDPEASFTEQDEYAVPGPEIVVEVFDSTGFLLDRRETFHHEVTIGEGGGIPSRPATSVAVVGFDLDDLSGHPDRVVVRLQDPVE